MRGGTLESEIIFKQFEDLEKKIDHLINTCKSLEVKNQELKNKIERLEEELKGRTEAENIFCHERDMVRTKIDLLLGKLTDAIEG
jgi:hypothetical protein